MRRETTGKGIYSSHHRCSRWRGSFTLE